MTASNKRGLDNKVVVITGAGSGMGREMAILAARRGARVAISDWNPEGLAETVDLVKAAGARELRSDVVDVSGALRRRFFRAGTATVSRVEVELARGRIIRRAGSG